MTTIPLAPGTADALLFDLGRVVLDIDFNRTLRSWAGHAGCDAGHLAGRIARDELYRRHEKGEISDAAFFAGLRTSLGVDLSDAQFLEGWNAIFAGEMPGIRDLLTRAAPAALRLLQHQQPSCRIFFERVCRCARSFP